MIKKKAQFCSSGHEKVEQTEFRLFGSEKGGYVFKEVTLELAPFAKFFATVPEGPLKNRHGFCCMICIKNITTKVIGLYELKRHFQRESKVCGEMSDFVLGITRRKYVGLMSIFCTGQS